MLNDIFKNAQIPKNAQEILSQLEPAGWTNISSTHSTVALAAPDNGSMVLRINDRSDYGFANYAELCQQQPSRHLQTVSWHGFLEEDGAHVAIMERLHPVTSYDAAPKELKPSLRTLWRLGNYMFPFYEDEDNNLGFDDHVIHQGSDNSPEMYEVATLLGDLYDVSPSLGNCVVSLQRCLNALYPCDDHYSSPHIDLHPENIMIRRDDISGKNTLVLTDPFPYDRQYNERSDYPDQIKEQANMKTFFGLPSDQVLQALKFF